MNHYSGINDIGKKRNRRPRTSDADCGRLRISNYVELKKLTGRREE